jgi:hypothetical protein
VLKEEERVVDELVAGSCATRPTMPHIRSWLQTVELGLPAQSAMPAIG